MQTHDLVVIGGGPAGIGTAYRLRDAGLSVKVLEAADAVGGRTRSVSLPGGMANTGAQFVYRGTPSEELVAELGLETVEFRPTTYGISVDGRTSVGESNREVVDGLGWSGTDRDALLRFLDEAVDEYRATTSGGAFTAKAEQLADQTVADRLRSLPPRVAKIIETAVRGGAVGDPEDISAQYALRYFASYPAQEQENRLLVLDGMQALVLEMAASLAPGTVELATRVTGVRTDPDQDHYVVAARGPRGEETYLAHQVLVAVPAPLVAGLFDGLPASTIAALQQAMTPGSTTMVVAVDVSGGAEHYRDWAFITTVGERFDCIINPTPGRWRSENEPGIVHFVCYGNDPGYQPDLPGDPEREQEWLDAFLRVAPDLRGRILGHHVQTWEHCFALLSPGRAAVVPQLQQPVGRVHFAGDWTSATAGTHGALGEAWRVAASVLDRARAGGRVRHA